MVEQVIIDAVEHARILNNITTTQQLIKTVLEMLQLRGYQTEADHFARNSNMYIDSV